MSVDSRLNLGLPSLDRSSLDPLRALEQQRPDAHEADAPASGDASLLGELAGTGNVLAALAWKGDDARVLKTGAYLPPGRDPVEDLGLVDTLVSVLGLR